MYSVDMSNSEGVAADSPSYVETVTHSVSMQISTRTHVYLVCVNHKLNYFTTTHRSKASLRLNVLRIV